MPRFVPSAPPRGLVSRNVTRLALAGCLLILFAGRPALGFIGTARPEFVVGPNEVLNDDLYFRGQTLDVRGTVHGDLVFATKTAVISGHVTGDVFAATRSLQITGTVDGTVRVVGGDLTASGTIGGDCLLFGWTATTVAAGAHVGRDVATMSAGHITLAGTVARHVLASSSGGLSFDESVGGNVELTGAHIQIEPTARVTGSLELMSANPVPVPQSLKPGGGLDSSRVNTRDAVGNFSITSRQWFTSLVSVFVLWLLFARLAPRWAARASTSIEAQPVRNLVRGTALTLAVALVATFGLLIGAYALLALGLVLGFTVACERTGHHLFVQRDGPERSAAIIAFVGAAFLTSLVFLPRIGWVVATLASVAGLGALAGSRARRGVDDSASLQPAPPASSAPTPSAGPQ